MDFDTNLDVEPIIDLPSPATKVETSNPYGSVPGLSDDELADPRELERMAFLDDWGPILKLPDLYPRRAFQPTMDESGKPDGAFGSGDFDRMYPFDSALYKADKLKHELRFSQIRFESAMEQLPGPAKYKVLDYFRREIIELDHIVDDKMQAMVRMDARVHRLREETRSLRAYSWRKNHSQEE